MTEAIFVLTVMKLGSGGASRRSRTWGWFPNLTTAETAVVQNHGDIYEAGYYDLAVLEEFPWGPLALARSEIWYRVECSGDGGAAPYEYVVKQCEKPTALEGLISFGMG